MWLGKKSEIAQQKVFDNFKTRDLKEGRLIRSGSLQPILNCHSISQPINYDNLVDTNPVICSA